MMGIRTKKKPISRAHRKSLLKTTLRWVCFFLVLLIICLHVSVKFWIGPTYVAMHVERNLGEFWSGPVRVDEVDFRYDGIMFVSGINFYDRAGTMVMRASGVELVLGNWPSLTSHARIIKAEHLDVWLRMEGGKLNLPVQAKQSQETGPPSLEYMGIKRITLRAASGRSETVFDYLSADITRGEGIYTLSIGSKEINDSYQFKIDGVFDLA
jgi:hypothetical protein